MAWIKRSLFVVVGIGLAVVAGALSVVWPYVRDDLLLDRTVRSVALDWRDFGRAKAQARLEYELDHLDIGMHVRDEDCGLVDERREVRCEWSAAIEIPATDWVLPLRFRSVVRLDEGGSLR